MEIKNKTNYEKANKIREDINRKKENIFLPRITQNNPDISKLQNKTAVNSINKCESKCQTFLTSRKTEPMKLNRWVDLNSKKNGPDNNEDSIFKLLKEKIYINTYTKPSKKYNRYDTDKNIEQLNLFIKQSPVCRNLYYVKKERKKLKKMKVGELYTITNTLYNKDDVMDTVDLIKYKKLTDTYNSKRFKTVNRRHVRKDKNNFPNGGRRKNINCALKYSYNKNRATIDEVSLQIQKLDKKLENDLNTFRYETEELFADALGHKISPKKKIKFHF